MEKKKNNSQWVSKAECTEISGSMKNELSIVKTALVGADMRGGLVKDVGELKSSLADMKNYVNNEKTKGRDWRLLGFAVLSSVLSGVAVAIVTYLIHLYA